MRAALEEQTRLVEISRKRLDLALRGANLGLWDWNVADDELFVDERWAAILGYDRDEIVPRVASWTKLLNPEDVERVERTFNEHLIEGLHETYSTEQRLRMKDGRWKWILDTGRVVERDADGKAVRMTGVILDIDRAKEHELMLEKLACSDPLTDVYNRRHLFSRLHEHLALLRRKGEASGDARCALAILDIDHFKRVNDTWGHLAGDHVLRTFAGVVRKALRPYDVLARYGGEEFGVLFVDCTREQARQVLERIRALILETRFSFQGAEIPVRFSAGVSGLEDFADPPGVDDVIRVADERLYLAKEGGRDRIVSSSGPGTQG